MSFAQLHKQLISAVKEVGLPVSYTLDLKGFSADYEGKYLYSSNVVRLYCKDKNDKFLPFSQLLAVLIHEAIHYLQRINPQHVRYKGIMHDKEFYELESRYLKIAQDKGYLNVVPVEYKRKIRTKGML